MDPEVDCLIPLNEEKDFSQKPVNIDKLYSNPIAAASNAEGASLQGPTTPDSKRETTANLLFDVGTSLTLALVPSQVVCYDSDLTDGAFGHDNGNGIGSPHTPKEAVFDPFAAGPDQLMNAPHCKKCWEDPHSNTLRQLDFGLRRNGKHDSEVVPVLEPEDDERLLETALYGNLLEAIVLEQAEGLLAEFSKPLDDDGSDVLKTPTSTSAAVLSGIAQTCPGAPVKLTDSKKSRNIDRSLCRKLEF